MYRIILGILVLTKLFLFLGVSYLYYYYYCYYYYYYYLCTEICKIFTIYDLPCVPKTGLEPRTESCQIIKKKKNAISVRARSGD